MNETQTSEIRHGLESIAEQLGIQPASAANVNIGDLERWATAAGGTALVFYALSKVSLNGIAAGLIGGALIYRAVSGHCDAYESLGIDTSDKPHEFCSR